MVKKEMIFHRLFKDVEFKVSYSPVLRVREKLFPHPKGK